MTTQSSDNSSLIALSLSGDHDAFRQIVERYQNLICALAFSACGNIAKSEDLTQETFLVAWQRLRELQEPSNLKAWLCGIVRNLARNSARKQQPQQLADAASNDTNLDAVAATSPPDEQLVAREEAAIVEQALLTIPETYREPLVLFYREEQSVQSVADAMGISADAVRQRLSRGRNLLRNEVEAVIARSLRRSKPTSALTIAIMTALPAFATQAQAAVVAGAAAKAAPAAAKSLLSWSLLASFASPIMTLALLPFFARWAERTGKTPREKRYIVQYTWTIGLVVLTAGLAISLLTFDPDFILRHPVWFGLLLFGSIALQVAAVLILSLRADRRLKQIRLEDQQ
jgi:RNA polymerase sigma factor (sigma-70 family)